MQRDNSLGILMDDLDILYDYLDDVLSENKVTPPTIHEAFRPLCNMLNLYVSSFAMPKFYEQDLKCVEFAISHEDVRPVLFSGGKCSLAIAINYSKRRDISPELIYVKNNNSNLVGQAKKHFDAIKSMADKFNFSLIPFTLDLNIHNPLFVMRLVNVALEYSIDNELPHTVSLGLFDYSKIDNNPVKFMGYTAEMEKYQIDLFRQVLPDFDIVYPMPSYSVVWDVLLSNKMFMDKIQCVNGEDIAVLYIMQADYNIIESVKSSYMAYVTRLYLLYKKEYNSRANIRQMWKRYFFYNIEKSKYINELKNLPEF